MDGRVFVRRALRYAVATAVRARIRDGAGSLMPTLDPRVDAYIRTAPAFARPVLQQWRGLVHAACPDVAETMKWSRPHFDYRGIFCGMAAFKAHCVFGFWKHALIVPELTAPQVKALEALGRVAAGDALPAEKAILAIIKTAARLNETGAKVPRVPRAPRPPVKEPAWLLKALKADAGAWKAYAAFSPSHRREYVEWITEARTDATRERRLAQAVAWIGSGKSRNWKYERT